MARELSLFRAAYGLYRSDSRRDTYAALLIFAIAVILFVGVQQSQTVDTSREDSVR